MEARWDLDNKQILEAQSNPDAREAYLAGHRSFIYQVASSFCRRSLSWNSDDELSVALIAFNESIDVYNPAKGVPFLAFTRRVIQNRLTDYVRRETRHRHLALDSAAEDALPSPAELEVAWANYNKEQVEWERAEEIAQYQKYLEDFGLSFEDLVTVSPKHRDTRQSFIKAAWILCSDESMKSSLLRKKMLPIKELALASGLSVKTLERGRKYIIALAIILNFSDEFIHLRSYIRFS